MDRNLLSQAYQIYQQIRAYILGNDLLTFSLQPVPWSLIYSTFYHITSFTVTVTSCNAVDKTSLTVTVTVWVPASLLFVV